jgi:hypothetical protein
MRRSPGPTKRLIPSMSSEKPCPHRYTEEEGLQLEVDCLECPGPQDLGNSKCLAGVINILVSGANPESVVLRGYIHKRYRGEALAIASRTALVLARVNRSIESRELPSDRRCRTCPASMEQMMMTIKRRLLGRPEDFLVSLDHIMNDIRGCAASIDCQNCTACVNRGLAAGLAVSGRR